MRQRWLWIGVVVLLAGCSSQTVSIRSSPSPGLPAGSSTSPSMSPSSSPSTPPNATDLTLATIQRLNASVGYVAAWTGGGPALARTNDGGQTWSTIRVPAAHLTALRFIDGRVGWAAGLIPREVPQVACEQAPPTSSSPCYGVVLRTVDSGATWQKSLLIPYEGTYSEPVQQIQAIDGQTAWALILVCAPNAAPFGPFGCPAEVRGTTDGGQTWATLTSGYIVAMRFATPARGWLAVAKPDGTYEIRVTSDGGATWTVSLGTTSGSVIGLDAANNLAAWVMTQDGGYCSATTCEKYELWRTVDGGATWSNLGNPKTTASACWGGHLVGPLFASTSQGWLADNTGAGGAQAVTGLLQTADGGRSWRCLTQPANTDLVSAADPLHIWVMTNHIPSAMFASDDGGASWRELNLSALT